jgi:N-acetylglucosaminyldiphosphoundecaprenol N-acetyl-beta-D-mannosaminyltransferase
MPSQQVLLFLFAGLTVNLGQAAAWRRVEVEADKETGRQGHKEMRGAVEATGASEFRSLSQVKLFGMQISRVTMHETVARVLEWCSAPAGEKCRYIVTPNVDHAVMFQHRSDLRAAYADASLVLADGAPIVLASRLLGRPLPERVAGSDLVPRLLGAASGNKSLSQNCLGEGDSPILLRGLRKIGTVPDGSGIGSKLRVFLLGAAPGVALAAVTRIAERWPHVEVVGAYSPPLGFENDEAENQRILCKIAAARVDLLIVGFGAPKQELWVHRHQKQLRAKVAICAGATIDFLAGHRQRSPVWMRRAGLEWLHRVSREPRRLASRYARDAWEFPRLVWREWRLGA